MAGEKRDYSPLRFPIGNCEVTVQGSPSSCTGTGNLLEIKTAGAATIKIYVVDKEREFLINSYSLAYLIANQKEVDPQTNCMSQNDLPTFECAAKAGKKAKIIKQSTSSEVQARGVRGKGSVGIRGSTRGRGRRDGLRGGANVAM